MAEEISFQVFVLIPSIWQQTHSVSFRETPVPMDSWSVPHLLLLVSFLSSVFNIGTARFSLHSSSCKDLLCSSFALSYKFEAQLANFRMCESLNSDWHCTESTSSLCKECSLYLLMPVRDTRSSVIFLNSLLKPLINSDNHLWGFSVFYQYTDGHITPGKPVLGFPF